MKRKILSLMLAVALTLGLAVPAMAYTTPDFTDVPSNHWAYESVMKMADAGVIKGTGNGQFSPEMKLSAEMFVVLVGRVVFPDVKAEGADWSGPYVSEAKAKGLLEGTNITDGNLKGDISRYDMAVILAKCVELLKVSATKADSSKVTDYGELPTKYVDAVLMAYGSGLIRGDQSGSFNGANSMTRQEAATVMDRLLGLIPGGTTTEPGTDPEKPEQPEKPTETEKPGQVEGPLKPEIVEMPKDEKMATYTFFVGFEKVDHELGAPAYDKTYSLPNVPFKIYYTEDGGKTSVFVAEGTTNPAKDGRVESTEVVFEAPESWGHHYGETGFYVSAETEWEGQRLVTGDLRTDGRAYTNCENAFPNARTSFHAELTPPEGLKIHFTFAGTVETFDDSIPIPGATVRLYLKDGSLISEATAGADGRFQMDCTVDVLDDALNTSLENYQITAQGELNGIHMEREKTYPSGAPMLYSLDELHINPYYQLTPGQFSVQLH